MNNHLQAATYIFKWLWMVLVISIPIFFVWSYVSFSRIKGEVLGAASQAVEELAQAQPKLQVLDFSGAGENFAKSYSHFLMIEQELGAASHIIGIVAPLVPKGKSYYHLYKTGLQVSKAGTLLSKVNTLEFSNYSIVEQFTELQKQLDLIGPDILEAAFHIKKVNVDDFPAEHQEQIRKAKRGLLLLSEEFDSAVDSLDNLQLFLGKEGRKRYLLLFQNSGELRPTGGFIGSLAIIDVKDGQITKWNMPGGGSYNWNFAISGTIASPRPLNVINPVWEVQDCNWFPDFRASAKKCSTFAEAATSSSLDGVIAFDINFVINLIEILGSFEMPDYGVVINHNNFLPITQTQVESKQARLGGKPKQFLADLFPLITDRLFLALENKDKTLDIAKAVAGALENKGILLYSNYTDLQIWFERNNWAGAIETNNKMDYLYVNSATVNGGKSDFSMEQEINYSIQKLENGRFVAQVEITRRHKGVRFSPNDQVSQTERNFNYLATMPNLSYVRLYAPKGSVLLDVKGDIYDPALLIKRSDKILSKDEFLSSKVINPLIREDSLTRITEEFGKTVFGNYILVRPGEEKKIIFTYQLPFSTGDTYHGYDLEVQKQPGILSKLVVYEDGKLLYQGILEKDISVSRFSSAN